MSRYPKEMNVAIDAAKEAASFLRYEFNRGYRPALDLNADEIIAGRLRSVFPQYGYHSEELGLVARPNDSLKHCWLVDPHDGTSAAAKGFRGAAVSIALLRDGLPVLGVVYAYSSPDDNGDLICWAEGQSGVLRNGVLCRRSWPTSPSSQCLMLVSQHADRKPGINSALAAPLRYRSVTSVAYRFALVAAGEGDIGLSLAAPVAWDVGAGHALLRGAGGDVFDGKGRPVRYSDDAYTEQDLFPCFGGTAHLVSLLAERDWRSVSRAPIDPRTGGFAWPEPGIAVSDAGLLARAQGCLLGQIAGDALGSLVEFKSLLEIQGEYPDGGPRELLDGGVWNTLAGQPTDDSEMALALARALSQRKTSDLRAVADRYIDWYESNPFDIGSTTSRALSAGHTARRQGRDVLTALHSAGDSASVANGALMRISPLGIWSVGLPPSEICAVAAADAALTHPNPICQYTSAIMAASLAYAIESGRGAEAVYRYAIQVAESLESPTAVIDSLRQASNDAPRSCAGRALNAFQNAFYRLLHSPSFEDGVVATARQGEDADTNAAIAGALLGAVHGVHAVPLQWKNSVLSCRPHAESGPVNRPRPNVYWPVDSLILAEKILANALSRKTPDQRARIEVR
jgi:ADP-ribosyl-[dinitrogen reductase] hydrolase